MSKFCWWCGEDLGITDDFTGDINCPNDTCKMQNSLLDKTLLVTEEVKPKTSYDIYMEERQGENMAIPQGANAFEPFIKLPNPLENKAGEIEIGDKVLIVSEFKSPESPKIKSALVGIVETTAGNKRAVGLNWTSYYAIAKDYGKDTAEWLKKFIVYHGLKKLEKGTGHIWTAEQGQPI